MAVIKVSRMWTAFIAGLFALLATLGLSTAATAAAAPTQTAQEPTAHTTGRTAPATVPAARRAGALERSMPPTMKQRIRAEAHGASPSSRNRSLNLAGTPQPDLTETDALLAG
ncbi:DUF6344 domain-containing protein [Streptomyces sp. H27-C3]|uniref:DUF6344 domain-containing protein n=1 Tax=Streptomyces sp. H27-C3 TaxID=3046305 RepID=UPI0024B9AB09|nr:DUF6344 domain-containing protein [Streptomyces sp. H27-C3]MDJ0462091.1 DUF6344 domain-containing protein [Streptomyces sp. H27-C3]